MNQHPRVYRELATKAHDRQKIEVMEKEIASYYLLAVGSEKHHEYLV
ncbi:hypothetical protein ACEQPO_11335 [Bacillus sp. SL00103]